MTVVTCPDYECRHNGYGECQLGIVAQVIDLGVVGESHCPYYDPLPDPDAGEREEEDLEQVPGEHGF